MRHTCATHQSRVPQRSSRRIQRRCDNIARRERTWPGFYFVFCVRQSSARGCRFTFVFILFIKVFKSLPVPASFSFYELCYRVNFCHCRVVVSRAVATVVKVGDDYRAPRLLWLRQCEERGLGAESLTVFK